MVRFELTETLLYYARATATNDVHNTQTTTGKYGLNAKSFHGIVIISEK